ncbi:Fpg/Nei family DNA glycosylase [Citricoccus sp. NR2]|uniref:Fpg/Nei family DNA glycosylase n=1 Tax=Citricoccus sp. NR2 TaxID=3004095 RepID=UPI0022DE4CD2|nr:DNA glycosylase [Citricoccus sp. NR2]WBL18425.1 Fpg/Nei family DNA glycosylase [Citricoccus sp. NR2]
MPEGHTIHRVAQQFTDTFVGQRLRVSSPQGRFVDGAALLDGHTPVSARAHGKHFFLTFDHELILNVHLGMYGAWTLGGDETFTAASSLGAPRKIGEQEIARGHDDGDSYSGPPEPRPTTRVRLVTEHGWADLVGASVCRVQTPAEMAGTVAAMGPDPLGDEPGVEDFLHQCSSTRTAIGTVLMDQSRVAGIGNIYRAEGLFRAGIDPYRPANEVDETTLRSLWDDEVFLMQLGVEHGRIITTAPEHRPGVDLAEAWPEHAYYVYQRQGMSCRVCASDSIVISSMAARKLYRCTVCQR